MLVQSVNRRVQSVSPSTSGASRPGYDGSPRESIDSPADFNSAQVYQMAWMARVLATSRPKQHVDISTSACFAAVASAFVPVELCWPLPEAPNLPGVRVRTVDVNDLPFRDASVESVSCSADVEAAHAGGNRTLTCELQRILAPDGSLLYLCPLGKASPGPGPHRVWAFGRVLDRFEGLELEEFSLISDGMPNGLLINPDAREADRRHHGLGCFWFRKPLH